MNKKSHWREFLLKSLVIKYCKGQREFYTKEDFYWPIEKKFPDECDNNLDNDGYHKWLKEVRGCQNPQMVSDKWIWYDKSTTPSCWRLNPETVAVKQEIALVTGLRERLGLNWDQIESYMLDWDDDDEDSDDEEE